MKVVSAYRVPRGERSSTTADCKVRHMSGVDDDTGRTVCRAIELLGKGRASDCPPKGHLTVSPLDDRQPVDHRIRLLTDKEIPP
jgi:hypothetical protein